MTGQQDVFARLRHGAVSGRDNKDGAVHLGCAGDHVLDVVGVTRAVHVGVVARGRFVFHVCRIDGDAARFFFGSSVNLVISFGLAAKLLGQHGRDRRRQRGLAVVNVTNRAYVYVRLRPLEFLFRHFSAPEKLT